MAFLATEEEENQQGSQQQVTPTSNETVLATPSATATPATAPATGPAGTRSGSFTNLSAYVNANQGNDAAMGQAVTGQVQGKATQAQGALEGWQKGALAQVKQGTVQANPGLVSAIQNNPTSVKKEDFQAATKGYDGPGSAVDVSGWGDAARGVQNVQDYSKLASSSRAADRGVILSDTYGQGGRQYTQGQSRLDNFILGAGQGGQAALKNIASTFGNFGAKADTAKGMVDTAIGEGKATSAATKDAVAGAAKLGRDTLATEIDKAASGVSINSRAADTAYESILADLHSPDAFKRSAAWKSVGIDPDVGDYYVGNLGFDPSSLIVKGTPRGLGDVVSGDDQAKFAALSGLLGLTSPYTFTSTGGTGQAYTVDPTKVAEMNAVVGRARQDQSFAQAEADRAAKAKAQAEAVAKAQAERVAMDKAILEAADKAAKEAAEKKVKEARLAEEERKKGHGGGQGSNVKYSRTDTRGDYNRPGNTRDA
jgi:hypothetical protein